jgi:hypothetical protein
LLAAISLARVCAHAFKSSFKATALMALSLLAALLRAALTWLNATCCVSSDVVVMLPSLAEEAADGAVEVSSVAAAACTVAVLAAVAGVAGVAVVCAELADVAESAVSSVVLVLLELVAAEATSVCAVLEASVAACATIPPKVIMVVAEIAAINHFLPDLYSLNRLLPFIITIVTPKFSL